MGFEFDKMPENTVLLPGESLLTGRHLPLSPDLTILIRNPQDPGLLYEIFREEYPDSHPLSLYFPDSSKEITVKTLKEDAAILNGAAYLRVPPMDKNTSFENFQNTVAILRGPHGCPWDKKQTHRSIRDDFLQEVYELLDGLDRDDPKMIVEELGDILLHVVLQTQIGIDNGEFNMSDVISHVNNKIIFRHQHVFGNPEELTPDQVPLRWEQIKQKEREKQHKKGGLLDGISRAMPALSMAYSYQKRAAKTGFDWEDPDGVWDKLYEELEEFKKAGSPDEIEEELGDILFCVVNLARKYKTDPESALRMANLKFYDRFHYIEEKAKASGTDLFEMPASEKEMYWNEYKQQKREQKQN